MRFIRVGDPGLERPGVEVGEGRFVDISDVVDDIDGAFLASDRIDEVRTLVAERVGSGAVQSLEGRRLGAPFARPHQILCIGLNYRDHAEETGQPVPDEPILSTKTDWEVELGVVIGRRASYLESEEEAEACIAGYVTVNDVSERAFQIERGGQWSKGKSCPTFNPAGPYLVTPDEVGDVLDLGLWLDVDGERKQNSSTAQMIFSPAFIVKYLSQFLTLEPGDLINTGTPPGVGMGFTPAQFLRGGEEIRLGISGLGEQRQRVLA
jgi:2-keto-4-pentenoate hydratase/2-oxohepta-3-ene-1,7-dioic acid hydratase in catechol pathway